MSNNELYNHDPKWKAVVSFVLGISGLFFMVIAILISFLGELNLPTPGGLFFIIGIVLGIKGRKSSFKTLSTIGVVINSISLAILVLLIIFSILLIFIN